MSAAIPLFPRKLELVLADEDNRGIDLGELNTTFVVSWKVDGGVGTAKITVRNLSLSTIAKLAEVYTRIRLTAGYAQRSGVIFDGQIWNSFTFYAGTDRITEIYAADGARAYEQATFSMPFAAGSSLHDVIRAVVGTWNEYGVQIGSLEEVEDRRITSPISDVKMTRDMMRELADSYGFEWFIFGGVVEIFVKGNAVGKSAIEVSSRTGMIRTPIATTLGIVVSTFLNPAIRPGSLIQVDTRGSRAVVGDEGFFSNSSRFQGVNGGLFKVLNVNHNGETRGQSWYTDIQAVEETGAQVTR